MSQTPSPRWIVIPPCCDTQFWQDALSEAAQKASLKLAPYGSHADDTDFIIVEDAHLALSLASHPEKVVAIISLAGPISPEKDSSKPETAHHLVVKMASELTRRAYESLGTRCYHADQFAKAPVALFDDLVLHCPNAVTRATGRRNRAVVEAMGLYKMDKARWSTDILDIYAKEVAVVEKGRTFDVTGKPRIVVHGPYLTMPKGQWQMTCRLEFTDALCGKEYRVDWGSIDTYTEFRFSPKKPGLYEIQIDWTWEQPAACEMRLLAFEGIFDGNLTLYDLQIARLS